MAGSWDETQCLETNVHHPCRQPYPFSSFAGDRQTEGQTANSISPITYEYDGKIITQKSSASHYLSACKCTSSPLLSFLQQTSCRSADRKSRTPHAYRAGFQAELKCDSTIQTSMRWHGTWQSGQKNSIVLIVYRGNQDTTNTATMTPMPLAARASLDEAKPFGMTVVPSVVDHTIALPCLTTADIGTSCTDIL